MKKPLLHQSFGRLSAVLVFASVASAQTPPDEILLKDYKPRSIFKIPETRVEKARYAVIDVHSHDYAPTDADVDRWVRTMDEVGLEKTIILSGSTRAKFDTAMARYGRHPKRFAVWCGIDYTGFNQPGFGPAAVAELERCHKAGATGVGELSDKGRGLGATTNMLGMHIDDPRMDPILKRCAELRMPVNIHVGEDKFTLPLALARLGAAGESTKKDLSRERVEAFAETAVTGNPAMGKRLAERRPPARRPC